MGDIINTLQKIQFHGGPCSKCGKLCASAHICAECVDPMDLRWGTLYPGLFEISETVHDFVMSEKCPSLGCYDMQELGWIIGEISWYSFMNSITANEAIFKILYSEQSQE